MSGAGDERAAAALDKALASGPKDVLELVAALRKVLGSAVELKEGVVHPLLHRAVRAETVVASGFSTRGLPLYRSVNVPASGGEGEPSEIGPLDRRIARAAQRVASAVREPAARGRVEADVIAHLTHLGTRDATHRFGSVRTVRSLLQRVDRGKPAVVVTAGFGDAVRRLVLHEGPWLLGAVLVFFVLKAWVVQVYQIPSKSMLDTLHVGDRVAVFLPGGKDQPERWAIVTYVRRGTTYVKRVVGLPGERIQLRHGDVYADGKLLVKPDDVRAVMRRPLHDWALDGDLPAGWRWEEAPEFQMWAWERDGFAPHGNAERGNSYALRDGYLVLDVDRGKRGEVHLELIRQRDERTTLRKWSLQVGVQGIFLLEAGEEGDTADGTVLASPQGSPPVGPVRLELSYVDGVLRARCGDFVHTEAREAPDGALMARIVARGEGVRVARLRLDADQHYAYLGQHAVPMGAEQDPNSHRVADGALFLLGDNTTNSTDSRFSEVGDIPLEHLVGPVRFRVWPPSRIGRVR